MQDSATSSVAGGPAVGGREALTPERIDAVLADFRAWLESLAADGAPETDAPVDPPVDLATIAAAFTALRHEIHLHTKAARAQSEQAAAIAAQLGRSDGGVRNGEFSADAVLEAADVLIRAESGLRRALQESSRSPGWLRWFAPRPDAIAAAVEGVALGVQRLGRTLAKHGFEAIPGVGQPFDPDTMEAVEAVESRAVPPGTVIEEIRRGYRRDGQVVRVAQVKVARG